MDVETHSCPENPCDSLDQVKPTLNYVVATIISFKCECGTWFIHSFKFKNQMFRPFEMKKLNYNDSFWEKTVF